MKSLILVINEINKKEENAFISNTLEKQELDM